MILFVHILVSLGLLGILYSIKLLRSQNKNQSIIFLLSSVFLDIDHLLNPFSISLNQIFSLDPSILFGWSLRTKDLLTPLHFWVYPTVLGSLSLLIRNTIIRKICCLVVIGWAIHLLLDGVFWFI